MAISRGDMCLQLAGPVCGYKENLVFSPLSIRMALSLVAAGAGGGTLGQMLSFLGSDRLANLNSSAARYADLLRDAGGSQDPSHLAFASGIWVDKSMDLKESYKEIANSVYGVVPNSVDFGRQAPQITKEINGWVAKQTHDVIKRLIPDNGIDPSTKLILANALYFNGTWAQKFDAGDTHDADFHLLDGDTVTVPFMESQNRQFVSSFDGFKVLKLPYRQLRDTQKLAMLVFLPDDRDGLSRLVDAIVSTPRFLQLHTPTTTVKVRRFKIPKFKFAYGFEASDALQKLGVKDAFDPSSADFRSMSAGGGDNIFISRMLHKAAIEVGENGTVAAAATIVLMAGCCLGDKREPTLEFVADHPFAFAITDEASGAVLFFGHVVNPLLGD